MWPLLAYGAITAGSMIMSYMSSEEAKKMTAAERQKMEAALAKIQNPNFRPTDLTPEELKVGEKFTAKMEAYIKEKDPQLYAMTAQAKQGRQARVDALNKLQTLGSQESELQDRQMMNIAGANAARDAAYAQDATIREEFATRGAQRGAGAELMLRAIAQDQARKTASQNSIQAYQDARKNALNALMQAGTVGQGIEADETNMNKGNTNIINDFNQRMAANQQTLENRNTNRLNSQNELNWNRENLVNDSNIQLRNRYAKENLERYNDMEQQKYNNEMAKYGREVSQSQARQQAASDDDIRRQRMISGFGQAANTGINYAANYKAPRESDIYDNEPKTQFNVGQQDEYQDNEDDITKNKKVKPGYTTY